MDIFQNVTTDPLYAAPKQITEEQIADEQTATTNLTMNAQMGGNLMMGNRQQQQDGPQGLMMAPRQTTTTIANLSTNLVDTRVAARREDDPPDQLAGELKNESSASKKNRDSKAKKADRRYNAAQAARQNSAMLGTRQRLEEIKDARKNAPQDDKGELIGDPPADLSMDEKKAYTKQEKAALDATIAEIEAKAAHELAKLEAKKKFHMDDKVKSGIMLDTDTMTLQLGSLAQQKTAWEEYGSRQQLGNKEAMLVSNKVAALQRKADDLREKRTEIIDERYRQQWVQDGNVTENGVLTSSICASEIRLGENRSLLEKIEPSAVSLAVQITLFTGKHGRDDSDTEQGSGTEKLDRIVKRVEKSLKGIYAEFDDTYLHSTDVTKTVTESEWIKDKRDAKQNPQQKPSLSKRDWIKEPSIGTLEEEQASYKKLYKQEQTLFHYRYNALHDSIEAQNATLKAKLVPSTPREVEVAGWDAKTWESQKEYWRTNMTDGSDVCQNYFVDTEYELTSVFPYTAEEMEVRQKIYAEVIAERGDTDSMEEAEGRTKLMNTLGYVPSERQYVNDYNSSFGDRDEETVEREEKETREKGAERIAELKVLQETTEAQQRNRTKYVYNPPTHGVVKKDGESSAAYKARNNGYLKLHPKVDYVLWHIESLGAQLLPFRHATLVGKPMSNAEKKEHTALEKKLLDFELQRAELNKQLNLLVVVDNPSNASRPGILEEQEHEKMLKEKREIFWSYASQTEPHSKEYRSAMKQIKSYTQKVKDWQDTCEQRAATWKINEARLDAKAKAKQG